ncbi:RagB/SusD family nutrient uptake outer membrane protein [Aestuariibaculum suncheonense]|uniref:RagB/SusD family nutrient uptake outer membrane protein n=1 Tax=Aestuariibaculum suncheonense TaxID=1028745 RepID=A0A8J6UA32_9FLAO|nr:RagB/SusD family nutrient uptake outer membrane protein [Aestuariibaculum suncheonense]MBD0834748.1 RagB/SusD family nutrient uptake outer membrane protein [Aestuariibaculum suncheonense]
MKTNFIIFILIFAFLAQSCELEREEYNKITPDNFYKTERDAELAIAALYYNSITKVATWSTGMFVQNINSSIMNSEVAAGDIIKCSYGSNPWEYLRTHQWSQENAYGTDRMFKYYNHISNARVVIKQLEAMDIPDVKKNSLIAEASVVAGWKALVLYSWYGPVPYPTDEMLANPQIIAYPERPSYEEFSGIIENFLLKGESLPKADFGTNFGRVNSDLANFLLMRLYMLEAGRTGDSNFWIKAKERAEKIIAGGSFNLLENYSDVFAMANKRNKEIIFATPSDYSFNTNMYHAEALPNNYPSALNRGAGSWGGYKILWDFYDTFNPKDMRLSGIAASYTTDSGLVIDRDHPFSNRHGVGDGAIPLKYDTDNNQVGYFQGHDFIVYRYADVLLSMAEILNELGQTATVSAPAITKVDKDGMLQTSDGGNSATSFINAIRVRAGLQPLSTLSKIQMRDSILAERSHELYCEGTRRDDLIRYQRVTGGAGYKKFDDNEYKMVYPIPVRYINEYKGNLKQNPGY